MLQFETKTLLACKLVKGDPKIADLVSRVDKNIANLGTLSSKAFQHLKKMESLEGQDKFQALSSAYASLAVYATKLEQCRDVQEKLSDQIIALVSIKFTQPTSAPIPLTTSPQETLRDGFLLLKQTD